MNQSQNGHIAYFGYGSLVNRATHRTDIVDYTRVSLNGWRRHWLPRPESRFGHVAILSVRHEQSSRIDGLLVVDHARNLPSLDAREIRYDRHHVDGKQIEPVESASNSSSPAKAIIYVAKSLEGFDGNDNCRILRSYLDAVMQGYMNKFGVEGLRRFVDTTDNFEIGIREDRNEPVYTRPVTMSVRERSLFDELVPADKPDQLS